METSQLRKEANSLEVVAKCSMVMEEDLMVTVKENGVTRELENEEGRLEKRMVHVVEMGVWYDPVGEG